MAMKITGLIASCNWDRVSIGEGGGEARFLFTGTFKLEAKRTIGLSPCGCCLLGMVRPNTNTVFVTIKT